MKKTIKILLIIGVCYAVFCWVFPLIGLFGGAGARIDELQRLYDEHRAGGEALAARLEQSVEFGQQLVAQNERDADNYRRLEEINREIRAENSRLRSNNQQLETILSDANIDVEGISKAIGAAFSRSERIERIIQEYRDREHEDYQDTASNDSPAASRADNPGSRSYGGIDVELYQRREEMSEWQRW